MVAECTVVVGENQDSVRPSVMEPHLCCRLFLAKIYLTAFPDWYPLDVANLQGCIPDDDHVKETGI